MKEYNWATLGCGVIANELATALKMQGRNLYSVANRTHEKAVSFAEKYGVKKVYENIDDVFTDENVDIIYISTPHNTHINYIIKALENKKNVLCEKAITLNSAELELAMKTADKNGVVLAEAMTIYHMPIYFELEKMLKDDEFGKLNFIQMNFGSYKEYNMKNRFFNKNLAGGALLDIGVYALSFIRFFMSETPNSVKSQVRFAETGVDEQAGIILMNNAGEMATASLSLHSKQPKRATISFDKAFVEIYDYPRAERAVITYTETGKTKIIENGKTENALYYEVTDMEKAINGERERTRLSYTKDVMKIMTDIRCEWNLKYPEEY